ncbi:MAG: ABC transporter permease subunit [Rubrobacter sp.]|nr:ABC transporter permease subunit [Rubrobacter sp.]
MSTGQTEPRTRRTREKPRGTLAALTLHTLRLQRRSVLIWGSVLGAFSLLALVAFPAFQDQPQINELVESYPPELRELFGIGSGTDLTTIEGFLQSQVFAFIAPLALSFFPILAAAGAIAGAEERGTLDVLLGNPVPRWQLVAASSAATAVSLLGILAVLWLLTWVPAVLLDIDLAPGTAAGAVLNLWPLCLFFGGLAMLCSAVFHRRVLAVAIPGAVLVAMYFVDSLGSLVEAFESVQPLSVFYHYGSAIEDGIDPASFAGVSGAAVVLVALAALVFSRRDIYT